MFYKQLLSVQILEVQKDTDKLTVFLRFQDLGVQKLLIERWWHCHLVSISPMFYQQLLSGKITKLKNVTDDLTVFFALLGSSLIKAAHKLIPGRYLWWSTYFWCSKRDKNLLQRHLESDSTLYRLYCLGIGDLLPDIFSFHSASSGICICIKIHIVAWIQVKF